MLAEYIYEKKSVIAANFEFILIKTIIKTSIKWMLAE